MFVLARMPLFGEMLKSTNPVIIKRSYVTFEHFVRFICGFPPNKRKTIEYRTSVCCLKKQRQRKKKNKNINKFYVYNQKVYLWYINTGNIGALTMANDWLLLHSWLFLKLLNKFLWFLTLKQLERGCIKAYI